MNLEKPSPLKTQEEIVNERLREKGMKEIRKPNEKDIQMDEDLKKFESRMAESKAKEADAEKLNAVREKLGINQSQTIEEKQEDPKDISESKKMDLGGMNVEEKMPEEMIDSLRQHKKIQEDMQKGLGGMGWVVDGELKNIDSNINNLESRNNKEKPDPVSAESLADEKLKVAEAKAEEGPFEKPEIAKPKNVENISLEPSLPDAREEIKGKVPADTFKDLSFELKKGYPKPDEALSDFLDSLEESKKKNSLTATVKRFVSFLKEKGKRSTVLDSMQEFVNSEKEKRKEAKQKKETIKSGKIDRIMQGDYRSNEAVAMDESMESARESGEAEKLEKMKENLKAAESMDELIHALDGIDVIKNNDGTEYKALDQQAYIDKLFKTGDERFMRFITRAPGSGIDSTGIRYNVNRVFRKLEQEKINKFKDDIRGNKKEEFKQAA